jgi:hypothetical protein
MSQHGWLLLPIIMIVTVKVKIIIRRRYGAGSAREG